MPEPVQKSRLIQAAERENIACLLQGLEEECFAHPWSLPQILDSLHNSQVRLLLVNSTDELLDFTKSSLAAGCDIIAYVLLNFIDDETAEILRIATLPAARRTGAAARLIEACQQLLINLIPATNNPNASPPARILLEVAADNIAALNLYQKFGFTKIHTRPGYYGEIDALVMEWRLTES